MLSKHPIGGTYRNPKRRGFIKTCDNIPMPLRSAVFVQITDLGTPGACLEYFL